MVDPNVELVQRVLARDGVAVRTLVDALYPVIQARVARVLFRAGGRDGRNTRQEIDDFSQEAFVGLFENGGRALRAWQPERGLSLANFVGLLAERHVVSILRSGRRNPFTEDPALEEDLAEDAPAAPSPESAVASRELLEATLDRLRGALSPQGMQLFELLFVEERSVEEVVATTGLSADAVYAWRSRLRRVVQGFLAELSGASATTDREKGRTP